MEKSECLYRLVKFYTLYAGDKLEWSTCSTTFEVLPVLVPESEVSTDKMTALALEYASSFKANLVGAPVRPDNSRYDNRHIAIAIATSEASETRRQFGTDEVERNRVWLGLVRVPRCHLPAIASIRPAILTAEQAWELVSRQECGIETVGETVDGNTILVKQGWEFYQDLRMLGYDHNQFLEITGAEDSGFSDDTSSCHQCGKLDSNDDGYTQNFRVVNECELLGINCGCYQEWAESPDALEEYVNDPDNAMELSAAESHEEAGRIKFIDRYIGGMTDGRGGSWNGERCREGIPRDILAALQAKYPERQYVFSRDESGQFQTYFSVWQVLNGGETDDNEEPIAESSDDSEVQS